MLKLFWVQALDHLSSIDREDEMLRNAPPRRDNPQSSESSKKGLDDDSWRLDMPLSGGRLIDEKGRVSRVNRQVLKHSLRSFD